MCAAVCMCVQRFIRARVCAYFNGFFDATITSVQRPGHE